MLSLFCSFENSITGESQNSLFKNFSCFAYILFSMSNKVEYLKNPCTGKKKKAWIKPIKSFSKYG